ncbi:acyltransferase family protein [Geodermatophilus sp. SYSU D00758]
MTTTPETVAPATHAGDRVHAARSRNGRLEFLDALRGVAALVVAVQHLAEHVWPEVVVFSHTWWRPGEFGVLVFFLCSGFIIPASMERRGDLAEFWIGRVFRLFPLYLAVLLVAVAAFATPWATPGAGYRPVTDTLLNTTMLQVFTTRPLVIGASWTLGYEMVFYLLMTVLFMLGWHRRSAGIATGLVVTALVAGGALVPFFLVQTQIRSWPAVVLGLLVLAAVVVLPRLAGRERAVALTLAAAVLLLVLNRPHDLWFALLLLASMFVGTALYRYDVGQLDGRSAAGAFGLAVAGIVVVQFCYHVGAPEATTGATPQWWTEAATFVSAYLVFGALFLLRGRAYPRVLVYLGTISYSVYLVHALVLLLPTPDLPPVPAFATMLAVTLGASVLTYHWIEKPGQLLGRQVTGRYRARRAAAAAPAGGDRAGGAPPAAGREQRVATPA